jgi:hypothetical protein
MKRLIMVAACVVAVAFLGLLGIVLPLVLAHNAEGLLGQTIWALAAFFNLGWITSLAGELATACQRGGAECDKDSDEA